MIKIFLQCGHISDGSLLPVRFVQLDRVKMHVLNDLPQITVIRNMFRSERLDEQIANSAIFYIEIGGKAGPEFVHELSYATLCSFSNQNMEVRWHKAVRSNFYQLLISASAKNIFV